VHAVKFFGQDVADQIALVPALHGQDEYASLRIVQSGLQCLVPGPQHVVADRF